MAITRPAFESRTGPIYALMISLGAVSLFACADSFAQSGTTAALDTGFTGQGSLQMTQIRQDAVGLNNSVAGITNSTLQTARGFRPNSSLSQATADSANLATARPRAPAFSPSRPASKPFSNISSSPTVSPYLGLFNTGIIGDEIDNYNTFVRPQIQQQQFNNQVQRQAAAINARFQQLSAQPAFNPQGSQRIMGTGHQTTFGYYSRFYPTRR